MSRVNFDTLLEAGCHFGHLKRKWNPAMGLVATSDTLKESGTLQWLLIFSWNATVFISSI